MNDPNGRYASVASTTWPGPDGEPVLYLQRRFIPQPDAVGATRTLAITGADPARIDLVAAAALSDTFSYWRICDANAAMHPADLIDEARGHLKIPTGPVVR